MYCSTINFSSEDACDLKYVNDLSQAGNYSLTLIWLFNNVNHEDDTRKCYYIKIQIFEILLGEISGKEIFILEKENMTFYSFLPPKIYVSQSVRLIKKKKDFILMFK